MEHQTAEIGEYGITRPSTAVAAAGGGGGAGGSVAASRWTTSWSTGQPATSHGHQIIAECPVCLSSNCTKTV